MNDYDDLDTYNEDAEHDMMVDFDYHINTDELPEVFNDEDIDDYVNNLNDWEWHKKISSTFHTIS